MDHAVPDVAGLDRAARKTTRPTRLNWRLVLAVGVNLGMWVAIVAGIRALLD